MSVNFTLYINSSPRKKVGDKSLSNAKSFDCLLKDDTSDMDPTLIIETSDNLSGYNYMYCSHFGKYYFITDREVIGYNLWRITAHEDVLESFASGIKANTAVIKRQQNKYNLYLDDPDFHVYNYERIQTLKFPSNNFSKTLQYVLVTNGEGSSEERSGEKDGDSI